MNELRKVINQWSRLEKMELVFAALAYIFSITWMLLIIADHELIGGIILVVSAMFIRRLSEIQDDLAQEAANIHREPCVEFDSASEKY